MPDTTSNKATKPAEGATQPSEKSPTTSWSVIQKLANTDPEIARQSLDSLLQHYRYPIYVFIRSEFQRSIEDSEDITQSLMIHLLACPEIITRADPTQSSLRTYLLGCARNFVHKDWEKRRAKKRGLHNTIAWDDLSAQERYEKEPANYLDPARLYSRRWALILLDCTFEKLRAHYRESAIPFDTLRPFLRLEGSPSDDQLADIAKKHRITTGALRVRIHRLRARWRILILEEIKQTLANPTEEAAQAEFEELLASL